MQYLSPVYEGTEPYIFVSYAHLDADRVLPTIRKLQDLGYRIWCDTGLELGTEYPAVIAKHLIESAVLLAFFSPHYMDSEWCKQEISFAIDKGITPMVVYLEETEVELGLQLRLCRVHYLHRNRHETEESFLQELTKNSQLKACAEEKATPAPVVEEAPKVVETPKVEETPKVVEEPKVVATENFIRELNLDPSVKFDKKPDWSKIGKVEVPADALPKKAEPTAEEYFQKAKPLVDQFAENGYVTVSKFEAHKDDLKKAAELDYFPALCVYGRILWNIWDRHYRRQTGSTLQPRDEAVKWMEIAADKGDETSLCDLALAIATSHNYCGMDNMAALRILQRAAALGETVAMRELGKIRWNGTLGLAKSIPLAVSWMKKAIAAGDNCEDYLMHWGNEVTNNALDLVDKKQYKQALELLKTGAESGLRRCQCQLAFVYDGSGKNAKMRKELGLPFDRKEALKWYLQSAEQGYALAQYSAGLAYEFGWGVEKNTAEARKWYTKAAEQDDKDAKRALRRLK